MCLMVCWKSFSSAVLLEHFIHVKVEGRCGRWYGLIMLRTGICYVFFYDITYFRRWEFQRKICSLWHVLTIWDLCIYLMIIWSSEYARNFPLLHQRYVCIANGIYQYKITCFFFLSMFLFFSVFEENSGCGWQNFLWTEKFFDQIRKQEW